MQDRASPTTAETSAATPSGLAEAVAAAWPVADWRDVGVAVAVSGGADSVALLRVLLAEKRASGGRGALSVVHFDHRVRGETSTDDARWVEQLAESLGVACLVQKSEQTGPRSEEALRQERRDFYRRAAGSLGARFLSTGHTADDQAETVLFRILRGSGPRGMAGIRPFSRLTDACTVARPLLGVTKERVSAYLSEIAQPHCVDTSNLEDAYTRNWLRNQVLPLIAERFPNVQSRLASIASAAAEQADLLETLAAELLARAERDHRSDEQARLDGAVLAAAPPGLVTDALRLVWKRAGWPEQAMTAEHWRRLTAYATDAADRSSSDYPGGVRVERRDGAVVLAAPPDRTASGSC